MSADGFNADYWIGVVTVAPVLALANTVTLTAWGRAFLERAYAEQDERAATTGERRPVAWYRWRLGEQVARYNFIVLSLVTLLALNSLLWKRALIPPLAIASVLPISMLLIGVSASSIGELSVATLLAKRKMPRGPEPEPSSDADEAQGVES